MSPKNVHIAEEIKLKVIKLLAQKAELLQRVEALSRDNEALKTEIQQQKNTIETLQTQNKIVKIAEMQPSDSGERQELKKMLNTYIRHIDDCIRLLSDN